MIVKKYLKFQMRIWFYILMVLAWKKYIILSIMKAQCPSIVHLSMSLASINGGAEYNMTREGYYYLVDFNSNINKNLIIYKHNIFSLLLSLSWLHVHGTKDHLLSHEERIKKIANNKLSLTCGDISLFIQRLLQQKGIESRIASFLTMEQWNTYDNVHTLLEVKVDEKWTLFDIDNNRYFMYKNKEMNLRDFFEDINWDDIKFVFLSSDENLDTQSFSSDGINYYGVADFIYSDIKTWYKRVLQILIILENEKIYIALKDTQYKDRVLAYYPNALIMTIDEFNKRFYGEKNEEEYPNYKNHF
ncbi:hypothetical protein [Campylobacter concisus]|uniref:hypothetical protein n=1 Tax=Campylobacter concisus TaxID=199 RepID=UPI000D3ADA65|nr:hypothetical protein [Campylobacter concisus]